MLASPELKLKLETKDPDGWCSFVEHACGTFTLGLKDTGIDCSRSRCDVSTGNILMIDPCERKPLEDYEFTRKRIECQGMIIDGDHARKPQGGRKAVQSNELSGTIPYMSHQRLKAWKKDNPINLDIRDDMESAYWVMLLEYLEIARERDPTKLWPAVNKLTAIYSQNMDKVREAKNDLDAAILGADNGYGWFLGPFQSVISTFLRSLRELRRVKDLEKLDAQVEAFWKKIFTELDKPNPEWESWPVFLQHVGDDDDID